MRLYMQYLHQDVQERLARQEDDQSHRAKPEETDEGRRGCAWLERCVCAERRSWNHDYGTEVYALGARRRAGFDAPLTGRRLTAMRRSVRARVRFKLGTAGCRRRGAWLERHGRSWAQGGLG